MYESQYKMFRKTTTRLYKVIVLLEMQICTSSARA